MIARLGEGEKLEGFASIQNTLVRDIPSARKIQLEIGDTKTPDQMLPQTKFMLWNNEVNFSLRGIMPSDTTVEIEDGKVKHKSANLEIHQYEKPEAGEDGGFEFEWYLPFKPDTNILSATIRIKGLEFRYQPNEVEEEGDFRPENVKGSYAVYHDSKANNEYMTGKAFHIYRPKVVDADGNETWCELIIDTAAEMLQVIVPQKFLDTAMYPVTVDPTFGYTTIGGSFFTTGATLTAVALVAGTLTAATGDAITEYWMYAEAATASANFEVAAYEYVALAPVTQLHAPDTLTVTTGAGWKSVTGLSHATVASTVYCAALASPSLASVVNWYYDNGSPPGRLNNAASSASLLNPFGAVGTDSGRHYSFYTTYTSGGGGGGRIFSLVGFGGGLIGLKRGLVAKAAVVIDFINRIASGFISMAGEAYVRG